MAPPAQRYTLEQRFTVAPDALWPFVSDTDRLNRAVGIAEARGAWEPTDGGRALIGRATQLGFALEWVEHPFDFVAPHRFEVFREYRTGPLLSVRSTVELAASDGGTVLTQTFEARPRTLLFAPVVAVEIGVRLRRAFQRVYRELAAWLATPEDDRDLADPLTPRAPLSAAAESALTAGIAAAHARGVEPFPLAVLEATLRTGDPRELGRLRPLELAGRGGLSDDEMIDACLVAADVGLLQLRWELLCPHCRVSAVALERPEQLESGGHCEACAVDLRADPAGSVELVFRPDPAVRESEAATWCLGSPAHAPHVLAQQVLAPEASARLHLALTPGVWLLTAGPGVTVELDVGEGAVEATVKLSAPPWRLPLAAGAQVLTVENDGPASRRVQVQDAADRPTVLTAARAAARALALQEDGAHPEIQPAQPRVTPSP